MKLQCGDLVAIHPYDKPNKIVGLVLECCRLQGRQIVNVKYVHDGHAETRWISEKFIKKID